MLFSSAFRICRLFLVASECFSLFLLVILSLCFVCLGLNFKVKENYVSCRLNFNLASPEIAIPYLFSDMEL